MIAHALPLVTPPSYAVELPLVGEQTITVFGFVVALGVWVGHRLAMTMARHRGIPGARADRLVVVVALGGFAMAHWVSVLLYFPEQVRAEPWVLLQFTRGLSSVGGFIGGALTFVWQVRRHRLPAAASADVLAYGLLAGFTLGRLGCALVHDHPGARSESWFAVGPWPDGTMRWDLGLVEFVLLLGLAAVVYGHQRWLRGRPGSLTVFIVATYGVLRFPLDFLRAEDVRYGSLTPAQYACLGFVTIAVFASAAWRSVEHPGDAAGRVSDGHRPRDRDDGHA